MKPEAVGTVRPVDQVYEIFSLVKNEQGRARRRARTDNVVGEFLENGARLVLC